MKLALLFKVEDKFWQLLANPLKIFPLQNFALFGNQKGITKDLEFSLTVTDMTGSSALIFYMS